MRSETIEQCVARRIEKMQQENQQPAAVIVGHEDWLIFAAQSEVAYTSFGSVRRYQPALGGLLLVRVDEMHALRIVTQHELDEFAQSNQIL